jgi:hypothetical protein
MRRFADPLFTFYSAVSLVLCVAIGAMRSGGNAILSQAAGARFQRRAQREGRLPVVCAGQESKFPLACGPVAAVACAGVAMEGTSMSTQDEIELLLEPLLDNALGTEHTRLANRDIAALDGVPVGIPPIGIIGLPQGWGITELFADDADLRVHAFRFPLHSRAYALHCGERLCAILRKVVPIEVSVGTHVVVQFNEPANSTVIFGTAIKTGLLSFRLRMPEGTERDARTEDIHFVAKVATWWDEDARREANIDVCVADPDRDSA